MRSSSSNAPNTWKSSPALRTSSKNPALSKKPRTSPPSGSPNTFPILSPTCDPIKPKVQISLLLLLISLAGCSFFVPAYDNPDSKAYEKEKEKARKEVKQGAP